MKIKVPSPAKIQMAGYTLRKATFDDALSLIDLSKMTHNSTISHVPDTEENCKVFLRSLRYQSWSLPMVVLRENSIVGFVYTIESDVQCLSMRLVALFSNPVLAWCPLAMYIRHLFWNFPARRISAEFPITQETSPYLDLYQQAGMQHEGTLRWHAIVHGQRCDVAFLAVLYDEFNMWYQEHERNLEV
jgi:hypothetical protein